MQRSVKQYQLKKTKKNKKIIDYYNDLFFYIIKYIMFKNNFTIFDPKEV